MGQDMLYPIIQNSFQKGSCSPYDYPDSFCWLARTFSDNGLAFPTVRALACLSGARVELVAPYGTAARKNLETLRIYTFPQRPHFLSELNGGLDSKNVFATKHYFRTPKVGDL